MDWKPNKFRDLLAILHKSSDPGFTKSELLHKTIVSLDSDLAFPINFPPRNPIHRQEILNGNASIFGGDIKAGEDINYEIIAISDELEIDEHLAASILFHTSEFEENSGSNRVKAALLNFYQGRSYLLSSIEYLFTYSLPKSPHPYQKLFRQIILSWKDPSLNTFKESIQYHLNRLYLYSKGDIFSNKFSEGIDTFTEGLPAEKISYFKHKEIHSIGRIIYLSFKFGLETKKETLALIKVLSTMNQVNTLFVHLFITLLDVINTLSVKNMSRTLTFIAFLGEIFDALSNNWLINPARALALQCFAITLENLRLSNQSYYSTVFTRDFIESLVISNLEIGPFQFAINYLFTLRDIERTLTQPIQAFGDYADRAKCWDKFDPNGVLMESDNLHSRLYENKFKPRVFDCLNFFLNQFILRFPSLLHRTIGKEDDQLCSKPFDEETTFIEKFPEKYNKANYDRRYTEKQIENLTSEGLYALISLTYQLFHGLNIKNLTFAPKMSADFLMAASQNKSSRLRVAFIDMVRSISSDNKRADTMYELFKKEPAPGDLISFLKPNEPKAYFSWNQSMNFIHHLSQKILLHSKDPSYLIPGSAGIVNITNGDLLKLTCLLKLISQLFSHSSNIRNDFYTGQFVSIVSTLFSILSHPVSSDVKALIFDTLASISSSHPSSDSTLSLQIWQALEDLRIFPIHKPEQAVPISNGLVSDPSGHPLFIELCENEVQQASFKETISVCNLINSLIHVNNFKIPSYSDEATVCTSLPQNFGEPNRLNGITPYIRFLLQYVFTRCLKNSYKDSQQMWQIITICLEIVNKCISVFDSAREYYAKDSSLDLIRLKQDSNISKEQKLESLVHHPGFHLITSLLKGSRWLDTIFEIFDYNVDDLDSCRPGSFHFRQNAIKEALITLNLVTKLQHFIISDLIPTVNIVSQLRSYLPPSLSLSYLDQLVFSRSSDKILLSISSYVKSASSQEISVLASKLISALCSRTDQHKRLSSSRISPLLNVIWEHPKSSSILGFYYEKLSHPPIPELLPIGTESVFDLAYLCSISESSKSSTYAILDSILSSLETKDAFFSYGHFLLGFKIKEMNAYKLQLFPASDCPNALHGVLQLLQSHLNYFIDESQKHKNKAFNFQLASYKLDVSSDNVSKAYTIISKLVSDKTTSSSTLPYLRSQYKFLFNHIEILYILPPRNPIGDGIISTITEPGYSLLGKNLLNNLTDQTEVFKILTKDFSSMVSNYDDNTSLFDQLFNVNEYGRWSEAMLNGDEVFKLDNVAFSPMKILVSLNTILFNWTPSSQAINPQHIDISPFYKMIDFNYYQTSHNPEFPKYDLIQLTITLNNLNDPNINSFYGNDPQMINSAKGAFLATIDMANLTSDLLRAQRQTALAWVSFVSLSIEKHFQQVFRAQEELILFDLLINVLHHLKRAVPLAEPIRVVMTDLLNVLIKSLFKQIENAEVPTNTPVDYFDLKLTFIQEKILQIWYNLTQTIICSGASSFSRKNLYTTAVIFFDYVKKIYPSFIHPNGLCHSERKMISVTHEVRDALFKLAKVDIYDPSEDVKVAAFSFLSFFGPMIRAFNGSNQDQDSYLAVLFEGDTELKGYISSIPGEAHNILSSRPNMSLKMFNALLNFLTSLSSSPAGAHFLYRFELFEAIKQTGILGARIDNQLMAINGSTMPKLDFAFQIVENLVTLVSSILKNSGPHCKLLYSQAVDVFCHNTELFVSVLHTPRYAVSPSSLNLILKVTDVLVQFTANEATLGLENVKVLEIYHEHFMNLIRYFSDRDAWLARLKPLKLSENDIPKRSALQEQKMILEYTGNVELTVVDILANALSYASNVFCGEKRLFVPPSLSGFDHMIDTNPFASRSFILFGDKPTIGDLMKILKQIHSEVDQQIHGKPDINVPKPDTQKSKLEAIIKSLKSNPESYDSSHQQPQPTKILSSSPKDNVIFYEKYLPILFDLFGLLFSHLCDFLDEDNPYFPFMKTVQMNKPDPKLISYIDTLKSELVPIVKLYCDVNQLFKRSPYVPNKEKLNLVEESAQVLLVGLYEAAIARGIRI